MMELERIRPQSVLYFDMESIIYYRKKDDPQLECGDFLGDLTNEIHKEYGPGAKCVEFTALGPKNYCLVIRKEDGSNVESTKVKGITINSEVAKKLSFEEIKKIAESYYSSKQQPQNVPPDAVQQPIQLLLPQQHIYGDRNH